MGGFLEKLISEMSFDGGIEMSMKQLYATEEAKKLVHRQRPRGLRTHGLLGNAHG